MSEPRNSRKLRIVSALLLAAAGFASPRASAEPPPASEPAPASPVTPVPPATEGTAPEKRPERRAEGDEGEAGPVPHRAPDKTKEEIRREVLEEVRRELDQTKEEIRNEVSYVESAEDARNYDAKQLKELKQTVNLLQLHGYFRSRGDLFNRADLGRGPDQAGNFLFPKGQGTDYLGAANMRLRLNPVLRVSDDIAVYGQIDVLDNVIYGGNPLAEPFFDATTKATALSTRILGNPVSVKRVWAEVETPVGQVAFGRMPFHWGEGIFYNDGNCLDCDFGTSFDRVQLTVGPFLKHVVTIAADSIDEGPTTANSTSSALNGKFGAPNDLQQLDDVYRLSVAVTRTTAPAELRKQLDNGEWVFNYGAFAAYRTQHSAAPDFSQAGATTSNGAVVTLGANFLEIDAYAQLLYRKLRFATEWAGIYGTYDAILGNSVVSSPGAPPGPGLVNQPLTIKQGAGILRGQYALLKQDSLLLGLDMGIASGDKAPGMGSRPAQQGSGTSGTTKSGDLDGRQYNCPAGNGSGVPCDNDVTNFRMNPDFRIDQLLWRNLFITITDAVFVRAEGRFKPGGRASGGADDEGFEFSGGIVYSAAVYSQSTPNHSHSLGVEADAAITYTSKDRFFAGLIGGFLLPFAALNNPLVAADDAKLGQVYRVFLGTTF